jgi:hypothetical protein
LIGNRLVVVCIFKAYEADIRTDWVFI